MTIKEHLAAYTEYLEHERKLAPQTIQAYTHDLRHLAAFLADMPLRLITAAELRAYMRHMSKANGNSAGTIRRRIHGFGTFWKWAQMENHCDEIVTRRIIVPRREQKEPEWLTADELKAFVAVTSPQPYDLAFKTLAWLGLRSGEVRRLRVGDVRLTDKLLIIRQTKGKRDRALPIPPPLLEAFQRHCVGRDDEALVFPSFTGKIIHRHKFNEHFSKHLQAAGITRKGITPKSLRHSFVTHQFWRSTPAPIIRDLAGHSNLQITDRYAHSNPQKMREAIDNHVLGDVS